jgi:DNA-binding transcriptional LysR family regulator
MDIKQLKFLIALDETRHFGQAAARCHITQPTLSMRLRNLEEELDLPLVNRGQRFEGFTAPGERVLAWARTVLAAYDGLAGRGRRLSRQPGRYVAPGRGAAVEFRSTAADATPARATPEPAL